MFTLIAFVITIIGCINWLLIGLLQYDFIAGFFGFQASIFSRIIYIIFGVAAVYIVIRTIANKGTFKVYEKKKDKRKQEKPSNAPQPAYANVEASKENTSLQHQPHEQNSHDSTDNSVEEKQTQNQRNEAGLFDEHFKE